MGCSPPGSSVHGIFQARILEWVAMPSSKGSSWPRDRTHVSCVSSVAGGFFTVDPPGQPQLPPILMRWPHFNSWKPCFYSVLVELRFAPLSSLCDAQEGCWSLRQCSTSGRGVLYPLTTLCLLVFFDSSAGLQGPALQLLPGRGHLIALVLALGHPALAPSVAV